MRRTPKPQWILLSFCGISFYLGRTSNYISCINHIPFQEVRPEKVVYTAGKRPESGWDGRGLSLYEDQKARLAGLGVRNVTFMHFQQHGQFQVSADTCGNSNFWEKASKGGWEHETFAIFEKYVNKDKTTVIDFGTWIGPTLLFHGSFSKRSIGVEADPVAFAVVEYNVELNKVKSGGTMTVDSACVARPEDKGIIEMRAGQKPGHSMSGIGEKLARQESNLKWNVLCYTLQDLFENYWRIEKPYKDVMVKIDIESYECKLIPSFYEWLKDEKYLPKMFISFHPQIIHCHDEEYDGVLKFLRLYDHVLFHDKEEFDNLHASTVEEFKEKIGAKNSLVIYQKHHMGEE